MTKLVLARIKYSLCLGRFGRAY